MDSAGEGEPVVQLVAGGRPETRFITCTLVAASREVQSDKHTSMKRSPRRSDCIERWAVSANDTSPRKLPSQVAEPLENWVIYGSAGE